jgi:hypothetical protein
MVVRELNSTRTGHIFGAYFVKRTNMATLPLPPPKSSASHVALRDNLGDDLVRLAVLARQSA